MTPSIKERLRRLSAGGPRRSPAPAAAAPQNGGPAPPHGGQASAAAADGVEVIRARFAPTHRHGHAALKECADALVWGSGPAPAETLWLDTETTGLAGGTGTYVFLVGLGSFDGATFSVEQFLLRRLSAEARFLGLIQESLARARHVVTFNGMRFDLPLLATRFVLTRLSPVSIGTHTDLIHPARRLWHRVLGTHRLSALEAEILGAPRQDDIPGWMIPQVYVHYLRTADRRALEPILSHNRADLLALLGLHARVARFLRDPDGTGGPIDWEGAGMLLARGSDHARAAACFERALAGPLEARDRWRVLRRCAQQYRRLADGRRRRALWEEAAAACSGDDCYRALVFEELAKAREQCGDFAGARQAAGEALRAVPGSLGPRASLLLDRLSRRAERLERLTAPAP